MAERLSKAKIEKFVAAGVPVGKSEAWLWDSAVTGLGLRMRLTGSVSWLFVYRPRGAGRGEPSRKVTIGSWPSLSVDGARSAARMKTGEVASGADPATERRVERTREKSELRLVLEGYDASLRRRHIVNRSTILSTLRRGLAPLMTREISTLERNISLSGSTPWKPEASPAQRKTFENIRARCWNGR